jgi:hypothetical protein
MNSASNSGDLVSIWSPELGLDPSEETKIADWVMEAPGVDKIGNLLTLRKIPVFTAQTYGPVSASSGQRANLNFNTGTQTAVTVTPVGKYSAVGLEPALKNRAVHDGAFRNAYKSRVMASLKEAQDIALFALAANLSNTVTQADIDDAAVRTALGALATTAKGKFTEDAVKLLVVHPNELKNVWNIAAIKEYQIRGTIGSAVNLKMNAYGLVWRESGNVFTNGASFFNPLLLKDAWVIGWNEKPHFLDVQWDGLTENYIAYEEFGVAEYFDSSGVALVTT